MSAAKVSIVRVVTAIVVGFILNLPITPLVLDFLNLTTEQASAYLGAGVTAVVSAAYFAVARFLEENASSVWGRLLILANRPVYDNTPAELTDRDPGSF